MAEKYRSFTHKKCNISLWFVNKAPVVFHNLRRYDSHFIMQEKAYLHKKIWISY